jgi:hypothetical protein
MENFRELEKELKRK